MLCCMRPPPVRRCLWALGRMVPSRLDRRPCFPLVDQRHQVRFESCPVFCRMTKQELNEAALPRPKLPVHSAAGETVQEAERLLGKETFEFVGGHGVRVECDRSNIRAAKRARPTSNVTRFRITVIPPGLRDARRRSLATRNRLTPGACPSGCGVVKETRACVQAIDKYRPRPSWFFCTDRST